MSNEYIQNLRRELAETYDDDSIEAAVELIPYELIHELLRDITELRAALIAARAEINGLTEDKTRLPYEMLTGDIPGGDYTGDPAMDRYFELYGENAVTPRGQI